MILTQNQMLKLTFKLYARNFSQDMGITEVFELFEFGLYREFLAPVKAYKGHLYFIMLLFMNFGNSKVYFSTWVIKEVASVLSSSCQSLLYFDGLCTPNAIPWR